MPTILYWNAALMNNGNMHEKKVLKLKKHKTHLLKCGTAGNIA
jgi:hypothetical protein